MSRMTLWFWSQAYTSRVIRRYALFQYTFAQYPAPRQGRLASQLDSEDLSEPSLLPSSRGILAGHS